MTDNERVLTSQIISLVRAEPGIRRAGIIERLALNTIQARAIPGLVTNNVLTTRGQGYFSII